MLLQLKTHQNYTEEFNTITNPGMPKSGFELLTQQTGYPPLRYAPAPTVEEMMGENPGLTEKFCAFPH